MTCLTLVYSYVFWLIVAVRSVNTLNHKQKTLVTKFMNSRNTVYQGTKCFKFEYAANNFLNLYWLTIFSYIARG